VLELAIFVPLDTMAQDRTGYRNGLRAGKFVLGSTRGEPQYGRYCNFVPIRRSLLRPRRIVDIPAPIIGGWEAAGQTSARDGQGVSGRNLATRQRSL